MYSMIINFYFFPGNLQCVLTKTHNNSNNNFLYNVFHLNIYLLEIIILFCAFDKGYYYLILKVEGYQKN